MVGLERIAIEPHDVVQRSGVRDNHLHMSRARHPLEHDPPRAGHGDGSSRYGGGAVARLDQLVGLSRGGPQLVPGVGCAKGLNQELDIALAAIDRDESNGAWRVLAGRGKRPAGREAAEADAESPRSVTAGGIVCAWTVPLSVAPTRNVAPATRRTNDVGFIRISPNAECYLGPYACCGTLSVAGQPGGSWNANGIPSFLVGTLRPFRCQRYAASLPASLSLAIVLARSRLGTSPLSWIISPWALIVRGGSRHGRGSPSSPPTSGSAPSPSLQGAPHLRLAL